MTSYLDDKKNKEDQLKKIEESEALEKNEEEELSGEKKVKEISKPLIKPKEE